MEDFVDVPTYDPDHNGIMRMRKYGEYVNIEDYFKLLDAYRALLSNQGG